MYDKKINTDTKEDRRVRKTKKSLRDSLFTLLREKNISQKQLAKRMGKTEAEVSRWLGGTHNFTLRTIAKISDALGVKLLTI